MLKSILCLSACFAFTFAASYAHEDHNHGQFSDEVVEEAAVEGALVTVETKDVTEETLVCLEELDEENVVILAGCPNCPRGR